MDQYNACYGGQACGLCTLSWVESDRPLVEHAASGWVGVSRKFGEDIDVSIYVLILFSVYIYIIDIDV